MNTFSETMQRGREGGFLRTACDVGLILSMVLWTFAQLTLVNTAPAGGTWVDLLNAGLRVTVSIVLAIGCAVVLPALLAIIFPFTSAGQLLQKTRRSTWGFPVMVGAAGFLGWYSYTIVAAFWAASLHDPQFAPMQTVATLLIGVVVPALAFSWSSPMTWAAEVQQAHLVKRLELAHQADIAAAKVAYFRAVDLLRVGIANMTAAERAEVAGILAGLQRTQNDTLQAIAGTFCTIAGAELAAPTMDDGQLVTRFNDLAKQLERRVLHVNVPEDEPDHVTAHVTELAAPPTPFDGSSTVNPREAARETVIEGEAANVASASESGVHVSATHVAYDPRRSEISTAAAYLTARRQLGTGAWTAGMLAEALAIEDPTVRKLIAEWKQGAQNVPGGMNGGYRFVDLT